MHGSTHARTRACTHRIDFAFNIFRPQPSATVEAIKAGCDVESAGWGNDPSKGIGPWATGGPYIDYLPGKVKNGSLAESVIDEALRHTVGLRFRLGLFDPIDDQPYWHVPKDVPAPYKICEIFGV